MKRTMLTAIVLAGIGTSADAQTQQKASGANPASAGMTQLYNDVKGFILKAAEQVPEEKYSYRPTPKVRTLGELFAHIVDAQATVCPAARGQNVPYSTKTEKEVKTRAALIAALKQSFAACDRVYAGATDASLGNSVSVFGQSGSVSNALTLNTAHAWEHYGNIVTYMRMLDMVPPSSQGN
jgi:uncharacterized damage-inducible protein DinB